MSNEREVVVLSGVRTAIGAFGGSLKDFPPTQLGAMVAREALAPSRRTVIRVQARGSA